MSQKPDPRLLDTDPVAYMRLQAAHEQQQEALSAIQAAADKDVEKAQAEQAERTQADVEEHYAKLVERRPEMGDPQKADAMLDDMTNSISKEYGITPEEIGDVYDHRVLDMAMDAVAFRKLKAEAPKLKEQVQGKPKLLKSAKRADPGAQRKRGAKTRAAALKKTGSLEAGVDALMDLGL